jgi:hypothetical protein
VAERPVNGGSGPAGTAEPVRPNRQHEDRRARIEELKRQKRRKERVKTSLMMLAVLGVVGAIFGKQVYEWADGKLNDPLKRSIASFGVPLADAECSKITTDAASGGKDHRQVGTRIKYAHVPPSSGPHYSNPVSFEARPFFTLKDMPPVENLVHNLEHGYTILWYYPDLPQKDQDEIRDLARKLRNEAEYQQFIATAWDKNYGEFRKGKKIALSHWSGPEDDTDAPAKTHGHRLLCGQLSGEAVQDFMDKFPASDAPERNIR